MLRSYIGELELPIVYYMPLLLNVTPIILSFFMGCVIQCT